MNYLKEYAANIVIISVLSTIFEIIIPEGKNKKTAGIIIGLVVMLTIMEPLKYITDITGSQNFPTFKIEDIYEGYDKNLVSEVFEENLSTAIKEKVRESLGKDIECKVTTEKNADGEITQIKSVEIYPLDDQIIHFIKTEFSLSESIVKGDIHD